MLSLLKEFEDLKRRRRSKGEIPVISLPKIKLHKLGLSENNSPVFFINCEDTSGNSVDSNLDLISIEYGRNCELLTADHSKLKGTYTIISLKTDSFEISKYFLEIIFLMIQNLPKKLTLSALRAEIAKIVRLFARLTGAPLKTLQGLWSELLIIEQSSNPEYLITSWHNTPLDRFDFNDGKDKVEVKSTSKSRRVHTFALEQLQNNPNSSLIIASVLVIQTGVGRSIPDLIQLISKRVGKANLLELQEKVADCLGRDIEKAHDTFFDYSYSIDNLEYFESRVIPVIHVENIPSEISNVHFDCDLSSVSHCRKRDFKTKLHKSLG